MSVRGLPIYAYKKDEEGKIFCCFKQAFTQKIVEGVKYVVRVSHIKALWIEERYAV
jgi:hypothetical protein